MVDLQKMADAVFASVKGYVTSALQPLHDRIKALEERAPEKGDKGEDGAPGADGASVTLDDIAPLVAAEVGKAVAAIPAPKDGADGKSVSVDDVMPALLDAMQAKVAELPPATNGVDGKDADPEAVAAILRETVAEKAAEWLADNPPQNGKDGKDGESVSLADVEKMVEERVAARIESEQAKWALDFERRAQETMQRALDRMPKPENGKDGKDGLGFDDLQMDYDGERTFTFSYAQGDKEKAFSFVVPLLLDKGVFKEGSEYEQGDVVTWGGSMWVAQTDTKSKPGDEGWRLAVKKGRDGKDGADGPRGPQGEKGLPGLNGVDRR